VFDFRLAKGGIGAHSTSHDSGNVGSRVNLWRAIDAATKKNLEEENNG
jgi:hypothetical protein